MTTEQVNTSTNFNMPVDEIIDMALQGLGGDQITHEEAKLARTSLNLVFIDLQNRGMAPLASLRLTEVALASGSADDYTLGSSTFNVLDGVIKVSTSGSGGGVTDLPIQRLSYSEWLDIPTKADKGRPTHFLVNRQRGAPQVNFWPTPDSDTKYTFKAWTLTRIGDVNKSHQLVDVPHRYLPAIVKGLRYHMADLRGASIQDKQWYKQEYYETLQMALDEDRERVDFDIYPSNRTGYRE